MRMHVMSEPKLGRAHLLAVRRILSLLWLKNKCRLDTKRTDHLFNDHSREDWLMNYSLAIYMRRTASECALQGLIKIHAARRTKNFLLVC